jgi:hypothetical protein
MLRGPRREQSVRLMTKDEKDGSWPTSPDYGAKLENAVRARRASRR